MGLQESRDVLEALVVRAERELVNLEPPRYETDWTVIRRPANVQTDTWKTLYPGAAGCPQWLRLGDATSWELEEGRIVADSDGSLRLPSSGSFMDNFRDGYPYAVRNALRPRGGISSSENPVGDLRFEAEVTAAARCEVIQFGLREGSRIYTFTLPGPAAAADETASILAKDLSRSARSPLSRDLEVKREGGWRLETDVSLRVAVENLDDRLTLEVDGEEFLTIDIPAAADQASQINVQVVGGGVVFDDVEVFRDIYYLSDNASISKWFVHEDHYIMLGDNTQDSSDSREWSLARYEWEVDGETRVFEGNFRRVSRDAMGPARYAGNPVIDPDGTTFFFRDKWGSRHAIPNSERSNAQPATTLNPEVPKELVVGRALVVFWPLKPAYKLWRLKWIR